MEQSVNRILNVNGALDGINVKHNRVFNIKVYPDSSTLKEMEHYILVYCVRHGIDFVVSDLSHNTKFIDSAIPIYNSIEFRSNLWYYIYHIQALM